MKIKGIVCALLALIICLSFISCKDEPEAPEGYMLVSGDRASYKFYAPVSWQINTGTSQNSVYYSTTDDSKVMITLYENSGLSKFPDIDSFWDYTADGENGLKMVFDDYTFISSEATTLAGKNAKSYTFTVKVGELTYKIMMVIAHHGDFFYNLTYSSTPENFDKHLDDVRGMMDYLVIV